MKALNLTAIGNLEYADLPDPKPQKGEVLLKIKAWTRNILPPIAFLRRIG
jgi:NADPH:quinone reductase-like Zn-dependent oxidoreductase